MKMTNKLAITILLNLLISFKNYGQTSYEHWQVEQRLPNWALKFFNDTNLKDSLTISDFVNPFYFEEDFNGDSKLDIAILVENKRTLEKGILIIHVSTSDFHILGAGTSFDKRISDFAWMDVWKVYRNSSSHGLTYKENGDIDDSLEITVHDPCLEIIKLESSSGLIYWNGVKYTWAQISD